MARSVTRLRTPAATEGTVRDAFARAQEVREPVWAPAQFFVDDRGYSLMNQLQGVLSPEGQVNYSVQHPGVVKAWHRHHRQTDFWCCLQGHIKVGVYDEESGDGWMCVMGERRPGVLVIPPPLWHGAATVGAAPAGLLYYVTHAYDPSAPDEDRLAHDGVEGFPWETRHG